MTRKLENDCSRIHFVVHSTLLVGNVEFVPCLRGWRFQETMAFLVGINVEKSMSCKRVMSSYLPFARARQDFADIFNEENPSGTVTTSDSLGSLIIIATVGMEARRAKVSFEMTMHHSKFPFYRLFLRRHQASLGRDSPRVSFVQ